MFSFFYWCLCSSSERCFSSTLFANMNRNSVWYFGNVISSFCVCILNFPLHRMRAELSITNHSFLRIQWTHARKQFSFAWRYSPTNMFCAICGIYPHLLYSPLFLILPLLLTLLLFRFCYHVLISSHISQSTLHNERWRFNELRDLNDSLNFILNG